MTVKIYVDTHGNYVGGFYGVNPPVGSIEVPVPPNSGLDIWNFDKRVWEPYKSPLEDLKQDLKQKIDIDAENIRLLYITPGAGQAMTYQQKASEAIEYLSGNNTDPSNYPLLQSEIGITADTLEGVALVVNGQYQAWQIIGASIESVRLNAKKQVNDAVTHEEANLVYTNIEWPSY